MSGFDWPALMRVGYLSLRLTPDQFWSLTPAELRLMLGHGAGMPSMNRMGLDALLAAYPDKTKGERDDGS
ncbi:rcc01693 family protein [Ruegeria faecimaris]|uniref:rcc01693 family protein n=1 Tax=Ruegeria faecimaris TaxID=686389 RepID=UPI00232C4CAA|nr:rcc01693 family protein [Ruegeria faecimaris]